MALVMKNDGGPNQRFFEAPETVAQFDSVRSWLTRNCKKVRTSQIVFCSLSVLKSIKINKQFFSKTSMYTTLHTKFN